MLRRFHIAVAVSLLPLLCFVQSPGRSPNSSTDKWPDYLAGEYDIVADPTYSTANNTELKLDLYLSKNRSLPTPTLILFHGGGWVEGQKERNVLVQLPYLALGWSLVNVEYRMAKNSPAPAAIEDLRCARRWVNSHAI